MQQYIRLPFIIAFSFVSCALFGQKCGHDQLESEVKRLFPAYENAENEFIQSIDFDNIPKTEATIYKIPVVVHIIWDDISDNISDKQVRDAIAVLNEDFRRMNADAANTRSIFSNVAADCEIEFELAQLNPQGNCTSGITRTQSALSTNANNIVKSLISWPNNKYMNIWVVNSIELGGSSSGTVLGYAYKPNPGQSTTYDGLVVRHDRMGRIGTGVSAGRTLTHEVGHYLGLDHPFNGGCFWGDNCADTPPVIEASYGCNLNANTCSNDNPNQPDQIENYMDYSDDYCMNMFTQDQRAIMRGNLSIYNRRGYLISPNNAHITGIASNATLPCAPQANFGVNQSVICAGSTIQFTDKSTFGNPTSWQWSFPGGSPNSSTDENPTVTYHWKGNFNVSLTVTNGNGTNTLVQNGYISVRKNSPGLWVNGFQSGFEFNTIPSGTWHVENADGDNIKWQRNSYNSYEGAYCVKLDNYNNQVDYSDALVTDKIYVGGAKSMNFSFKYAVASKPGFSGDRIVVSVSQDCGESWQSARTLLGPVLYAATSKANPWNPPSSNNWRSININLDDYIGADPIMIKIDFISGGGNNAFLDDFQLVTVLDNEEISIEDVQIIPTPSNGLFQVRGLPSGSEYVIYTVDGRLIQKGRLNFDRSIHLESPQGYYIFQSGGLRKPIIIQ